MKRKQSGFTLIELIAVIVILGLLAATAVPRFVDLQTAARSGKAEGVAGALASASAMNYATGLAEAAGVTGANALPILTGSLAEVRSLLDPTSDIDIDGAGTDDYGVVCGLGDDGGDGAFNALGEYWDCTLTDSVDPVATADFVLHYVP